MKLFGGTEVIKQFAAWGFPTWFPTAIGLLEISGAIGLLIPTLKTRAIYGLITLMVGAIYTHVVKEGIPLHSVGAVVMMLLCLVVVFQNPD